MCGSLMYSLTASEIRHPLTRASGDRQTAELAGQRFRATASRTAATARLGRTAAAVWSRVGTTWSWPQSQIRHLLQREQIFTRVQSIFTSVRLRPGVRPARKATGSI